MKHLLRQNERRPKVMVLRSINAGLLMLLGACSSSIGPRIADGSIRIQPTASHVAFRPSGTLVGFTVPLSVTNNSHTTVYLVGSGCGINAERYIDGVWRPLPNRGACALVLNPPFPLQQGESLDLNAGIVTDASSAGPGQYRVVLPLALEVDGRFVLLAEDLRASSPFTVMNPP